MFGIKKQPKQVDMKAEMLRRKSQRNRILDLLKSGNAVYTSDLMKIAANYTMRISDLRKDGHVIFAEYEKPGVWRYTYIGRKDDN